MICDVCVHLLFMCRAWDARSGALVSTIDTPGKSPSIEVSYGGQHGRVVQPVFSVEPAGCSYMLIYAAGALTSRCACQQTLDANTCRFKRAC